MLKLRLAAPAALPLGGSRDVLALALAGAEWLHHYDQPHHHGARRQAAAPRLVGRHCRQSNFRRVVGVAKLALNLRKLCWCGWLDARRKKRLAQLRRALKVRTATRGEPNVVGPRPHAVKAVRGPAQST